jgi:hypothetical protein
MEDRSGHKEKLDYYGSAVEADPILGALIGLAFHTYLKLILEVLACVPLSQSIHWSFLPSRRSLAFGEAVP